MRWMSSLGIKLSPGRTSHYERVIRHWKDAYKGASVDEGREIFPDFVSSMFEIFDFMSIYKAFGSMPRVQLISIIEKLKKAVNGPISSADETPDSTAARNFLFEATVAAKGHRPEKGVEAIFDAKSDTGIRVNGKKIWAKCKRVTMLDRIEDNVRKASSQLEAILEKEVGSGHRAVVALDISKILNRGDKIFVARSDGELLASVDRMMDDFISQQSEVWERIYKRRHKKIIGTIIRFAFMASSEAKNILVHTSQWAVNPRLGIAPADDQLQRQVATALRSSP
jgi:hypothetical protein